MLSKTVAGQFDSLAMLREAHADLLRDLPAQDLNEAQRARVLEFLERGAAAGAAIDAPADRRAAQGLLDYWKATLYTQRRESASTPPLPKALLRDFDEQSVGSVVDSAEKYIAALPPAEMEVARHLLLALVTLKPDASGFVPTMALRGQLNELGPQAGSIFDALLQAGALRALENAEPAVELSSEALLRQWPRLVIWLEQRRRLRATARFWERRGRPRDGLLVGAALRDAQKYRDLDRLEREFLQVSSQREDSVLRLIAGGALLLAMVAMGFAVVAFIQRGQAIKQKESERIAKVAEQDAKTAEIAARKRAESAELKQRQIERANWIASLLRALGDVALAETPAEKTLARRHWDVVAKRASQDPDTAASLKLHARSIDEIIKDPKQGRANVAKQSAEYNDLRLDVLHLAHDFRNEVLDSKDTEAIGQLMALRNDYYGTLVLLTAEITAAAHRTTPLVDVLPYVDEFWRLYWGEMCMVESRDVEAAMKHFGDVLSKWEKRENNPAGSQLANELKTAQVELDTQLAAGMNEPLERAASGGPKR